MKSSGEALTLDVTESIEKQESVCDRVSVKNRWDLASEWMWSANRWD